ncbi:hypothetical protein HY492_00980 [Candidatus Woesearchaeota archaeon]|nr:hypothetical protein [Candidatus Woesearchaeota archaeon]
MGLQVEISQSAYRKLAYAGIAERLYSLFGDRPSSVPSIPEHENVPAHLQDHGVIIQEQLELDNLCGFPSAMDTRLALGAFWVGEYPYTNRCSWRKSRLKTTLSMPDLSRLVVAQHTVDVPEVYIITDQSNQIDISRQNWPAFLFTVAQFAGTECPKHKLKVNAAEWCRDEEDFEAFAMHSSRSVKGQTAAFTDAHSLQVPYRSGGKLRIASRFMEKEDWFAYHNQEPLECTEKLTFTPEEGYSLFMAAIRMMQLPYTIVSRLIEEAYR